jgi:hypothetical protein
MKSDFYEEIRRLDESLTEQGLNDLRMLRLHGQDKQYVLFDEEAENECFDGTPDEDNEADSLNEDLAFGYGRFSPK